MCGAHTSQDTSPLYTPSPALQQRQLDGCFGQIDTVSTPKYDHHVPAYGARTLSLNELFEGRHPHPMPKFAHAAAKPIPRNRKLAAHLPNRSSLRRAVQPNCLPGFFATYDPTPPPNTFTAADQGECLPARPASRDQSSMCACS